MLIDVDAGMCRVYGGNRVYLEMTPGGEMIQHSKGRARVGPEGAGERGIRVKPEMSRTLSRRSDIVTAAGSLHLAKNGLSMSAISSG